MTEFKQKILFKIDIPPGKGQINIENLISCLASRNQ